MITEEELSRVKRIRKMTEDGEGDKVSRDDRQWILDLHKREGVPVDMGVLHGAQEAGFDVEGLKVKESEKASND